MKVSLPPVLLEGVLDLSCGLDLLLLIKTCTPQRYPLLSNTIPKVTYYAQVCAYLLPPRYFNVLTPMIWPTLESMISKLSLKGRTLIYHVVPACVPFSHVMQRALECTKGYTIKQLMGRTVCTCRLGSCVLAQLDSACRLVTRHDDSKDKQEVQGRKCGRNLREWF